MSDTEFGIGMSITRQDMAVMIDRLMNLAGTEGAAAFSDGDNIASYAREAVARLSAAGIMNGSDNMFRPTDRSTRAEAAVVIWAKMNYNK